MSYALTEKEAEEGRGPTPEQYAESQKERRIEAIRTLSCFDEAEVESVVKEASAMREYYGEQLDYEDQRYRAREEERRREWYRRYNAAMGKEPEPLDDELPW